MNVKTRKCQPRAGGNARRGADMQSLDNLGGESVIGEAFERGHFFRHEMPQGIAESKMMGCEMDWQCVHIC
jgi:hypothetical protein